MLCWYVRKSYILDVGAIAMTVTLKDAQAHLAQLIANAVPGEEIVITMDEKPVARLIPASKPAPTKKARVAGSAKGQLIILQEDDEHLKDFAEYMQ
jgi:prevent-host-death family protein